MKHRATIRPWTLTLAVLVVFGVASVHAADAPGPVKVEVVQRDGHWQLLRGGQPYFVKGAGGSGNLELLAACGGNSIRTWGSDEAGPLLDQAQKLGLTVTVGIWLGHERHGFDYTSLKQVSEQYERARQAIERYKNHPALLAWGLGNEMEGVKDGDNAAIWSAINNLAVLAHKLDPNHPTMTITAEIGGKRVESLHRLCPDIDIMGINSYGGVPSIPERYRKAGGTKPYIVTEYGPPGVWEIGRNAWGAVEEWTSTKKAEFYRKGYQTLAADQELCLGCYAFTWGSKQEATSTWFGILLPDGSRVEAADALTEVWTGKPPKNRCPKIEKLAVSGAGQVEPEATVRVELAVTDPENDPLDVKWILMRDPMQYNTGGENQAAPPTFPEAIVKADLTGADLRMPKGGGGYRLFAYVHDQQGGAAVANVPLRVSGPEAEIRATVAKLPLIVVGDDAKATYTPSGWMGDYKSLTMDEQCADQPHTGKVCLKFEFSQPKGWAGVVWQSPAGDWGEVPGGFDLSGAKKLTFWARGKAGGEKVKFGFGLLGKDKKFGDSAKGDLEVTLTTEWKEHSIDLAGKDLKRIKTGLYWTLGGQGKPVVFYLDDVQYE